MALELVTVPCRKDNFAFLLHDAASGEPASGEDFERVAPGCRVGARLAVRSDRRRRRSYFFAAAVEGAVAAAAAFESWIAFNSRQRCLSAS